MFCFGMKEFVELLTLFRHSIRLSFNVPRAQKVEEGAASYAEALARLPPANMCEYEIVET